jgi:hypothetical protein
MIGDAQLEFDGYQTTQHQPHSREPVWVQGVGYRRLAVFDDKKWRLEDLLHRQADSRHY